MDINPYRFEAEFTKFEFANFHKSKGTTFFPCSMAWLSSSGGEETLFNYWLTRFSPIVLQEDQPDYKPSVIAICNRNGTEKGKKM